MKLIAALLSVCILFMSASAIVTPAEHSPCKDTCCHKMAGMSKAQMQKMKQQHRRDCEKQTCTLMFSCPLCGFIVKEPLTVQPGFYNYTEKPVSLYKIGALSAYHPSDWKPPKSC